MISLFLVTIPFFSIGQNREVLLYDPVNMPLLSSHYERFQQGSAASSIEGWLYDLMTYVRRDVFDLSRCSESAILQIADKHSVVPLDTFIGAGIGVCRHFSLTTGYFIERFLEENQLEGSHYWVRGQTPGRGRHAWNLLAIGPDIWLIDLFWGQIGRLNSSKERVRLAALYGNQNLLFPPSTELQLPQLGEIP